MLDFNFKILFNEILSEQIYLLNQTDFLSVVELFRAAAKKFFFLVAQPLSGEGGGRAT